MGNLGGSIEELAEDLVVIEFEIIQILNEKLIIHKREKCVEELTE